MKLDENDLKYELVYKTHMLEKWYHKMKVVLRKVFNVGITL
jgi:hypothetical protein